MHTSRIRRAAHCGESARSGLSICKLCFGHLSGFEVSHHGLTNFLQFVPRTEAASGTVMVRIEGGGGGMHPSIGAKSRAKAKASCAAHCCGEPFWAMSRQSGGGARGELPQMLVFPTPKRRARVDAS